MNLQSVIEVVTEICRIENKRRIQRAPGSESKVGVSHLRVTDNGRWALATVTLH